LPIFRSSSQNVGDTQHKKTMPATHANDRRLLLILRS
jgi:hypothetical protein